MYVCRLLGMSRKMEAWRSHVSDVRLVCVPNGRARSPPSATSMPAIRGDQGSRLVGEPRAITSHGDDCGLLLCAACALGMGGYRRGKPNDGVLLRCRDTLHGVLSWCVPAAGCRMPGRGRAELPATICLLRQRRQGGISRSMQSL
jgi:hypothetical protein